MLKKTITVLCVMCFVSNVNAEVLNTRESLGESLNSTVKELKGLFNNVDSDIKTVNDESIDVKNTADSLYLVSKDGESNPKILEHGKKSVPLCDYSHENLQWNGTSWACKSVTVQSDCIPAPDEYRYLDEFGDYVCSKTPKGADLNSYWKFLGYSTQCESGSIKQLYGCYYTNKIGAEVQIEDNYCKDEEKPKVTDKKCSVPPSFTCQPYGPGWNLEGRYCYKTVFECKYSGNTPKYMIQEKPYYDGTKTQYYCSLEWYPDVSYKSNSLSSSCKYVGYNNRMYEAKRKMNSNSYEVCTHVNQQKDGLPLCPSSYTYDNKTMMCLSN